MTEVRSFPGEWSEADRQSINEAMGIAEPPRPSGLREALLTALLNEGVLTPGTEGDAEGGQLKDAYNLRVADLLVEVASQPAPEPGLRAALDAVEADVLDATHTGPYMGAERYVKQRDVIEAFRAFRAALQAQPEVPPATTPEDETVERAYQSGWAAGHLTGVQDEQRRTLNAATGDAAAGRASQASAAMSPETVAGRVLVRRLSGLHPLGVSFGAAKSEAAIVAIEQEAAAKVRAELAQQVAGLGDRGTTPFEQGWDRAIAAVLDLIQGRD